MFDAYAFTKMIHTTNNCTLNFQSKYKITNNVYLDISSVQVRLHQNWAELSTLTHNFQMGKNYLHNLNENRWQS